MRSALLRRWFAFVPVVALGVACRVTPAPRPVEARPAADVTPAFLAPVVDHHQHLISPALARLWSAKLTRAVLPDDVSELVAALEKAWNDESALAGRYASDSILSEPRSDDLVRGRTAVVARLAHLFQAPYTLVPASFQRDAGAAALLVYLERPRGEALVPFGEALLTIAREDDGAWRVLTETLRVPGPEVLAPFEAKDLIRLLDEAGIRRAVDLSGAYAWSDKSLPPSSDEYAHVRAENDWNAQQVAPFADRLVLFCGISPIRSYALDEIRRCATDLHARGIKMHFSNSGVVLSNPEHLAAVRAVFAEANRLELALVVHLQTETEYGAREAHLFLEQILPAAPDVDVQIAHMAGSGPGWNDDALGVYVDALARRDPRTAHLYFDVATNAEGQSSARLALLAKRIRQIGTRRILYGSDASFGRHLTPRQEWATFQGFVPLSPGELASIAGNVAPYLSPRVELEPKP